MKEAVFCPSPDRANFALQGLVGVVNLLCAGCAPPSISPFLCGATLLACRKKGGGLRPIAIGEVLRRLTSKCVSWAVQADATGVLSPLQVGVGITVGCESIVHSVVSLQEDPNIPPESRCSLLVDFSNAFNSVDRGCMFQEVRSRIPSMAAWVESCYGSQPLLYLGDDKIFRSCGVQQDDPLGPLCFAPTLHPVVEQIKMEVPGLLINAWYLDDGTLCGSCSDIYSALTIIESQGPSRGLLLNKSKSLWFVLADATLPVHVLPHAVPTTNGGFELLGSPVGPPSFCESSVYGRVSKIQDMLVSLRDLHNSQMETSLLRSCLSLPKNAFALHTCAPDFIHLALAAFDNTMREALSDLAGGPLSDWSWLKASLPSSLGGLSLRRAMLHAPAAYVGSLHQSNALTADILGHPPATFAHLSQCLAALAIATARPEWSSLQDVDVPLRQHALSRVIDESSFDALIDSAPDTRSRALAVSSANPHAGDWLNVVPSSALGLHLPDREFRPCLQYWLGLPKVGDAVFFKLWQTHLGIIMLVAGATGTESIVTTPSEMQFFQQLKLLP